MRDELLDFAWTNREAFVYRIEPLADSIARAQGAASDAGAPPARHPSARGDGPVLLLDHYDNAASGGTMDSMTVLRAILEAELEDVAVFAIHDPGAVRELIAAGVGAEATVMLGGKIDMPAINMAGEPLEVTGRVKLIADGRFRNLGPASTGVEMNMGPTVVLDTGRVEIVVISRHHEPNDLNCFLSLGIDPRARRFLMLKSRIHYRAGFSDVARDIIECAGTGSLHLRLRHARLPQRPPAHLPPRPHQRALIRRPGPRAQEGDPPTDLKFRWLDAYVDWSGPSGRTRRSV